MKIIGQIPPWMLLCLFALSQTTEAICSSALPSIASFLKVQDNLVQLSSGIYFIGFAIGILSLGRISDIYGRRPIVIFGISLYLCTSLCIIFAQSIETLILLRFIQGFGGSVGSVIGQAMARDSYKGSELSYIYASTAVWLALIPSIGSVIGGYIIQYETWRHSFGFLACLSALMLVVYFLKLPETNAYIGDSVRASYYNVFKIVIKDKSVMLYTIIIGSFTAMAFGFYVEAPFIFMKYAGMQPSKYGILPIALSLACVLGSSIAKYLIKKSVNTKKIMTAGLVCSLVGCSSLEIYSSFILDYKHDGIIMIFGILFPMMLHLVGHNLLIPLSLRYVLEDYSRITGTAGSIFGFLYYFLVFIIITTISRIHSDSIHNFTLLFLLLSIICCISFYLICKISKIQKASETS